MTFLSLRHAACCLLLVPAGLAAQSSLPKQSPFTPGAPGAAPVTANETLEFAGVSSIGKKTDVIIVDKTSKRKHWIPVGETSEGISVVKYDPTRELAIIRVNGSEKVLPLRKPTRTTQTPGAVAAVPTGFNVPPAPAPTPLATAPAAPEPVAAAPAPVQAPAPATAAPQTPEAQAKAETEARMLVSDLLEIGMAQRKAYEEAQRKAASGGTEPSAQPPGVQGEPSSTQPAQPGATATPPAAQPPPQSAQPPQAGTH